jgi:hypothetical protein
LRERHCITHAKRARKSPFLVDFEEKRPVAGVPRTFLAI